MRELGTTVLALWRSRMLMSFILWMSHSDRDRCLVDWLTHWLMVPLLPGDLSQKGQASSPLTLNHSRYTRREEGKLAWSPASAVPVPRLSLAPCAGTSGACQHGLGTLLYLTFPRSWLLCCRETPRRTEILPGKVNVRGCILSSNSFWKIKISLQTVSVSRCCKACRMH